LATLSELLRSVSQSFVVLAGHAGLGREVGRVVHVGPSRDLVTPVGSGDLVVYAASTAHSDRETRDRALLTLLGSGVVGVLADAEPSPAAVQTAEQLGSPLLASVGGIETDQLCAQLVGELELQDSRLRPRQMELQHELSDLARAGATPAMLLDRLVELTGKAGLLQAQDGRLEQLQQPVLQHLEPAQLRRAIEASNATARRWLLETADATVANTLYLELPGNRLVRLVAPVWLGDEIQAAVSLFARPSELAARDRVALLAAARAMSVASPAVPNVVSTDGKGRWLAVVVRAPEADPDDLLAAARTEFDRWHASYRVSADEVQVWIVSETVDPWEWSERLVEWQAELRPRLGPMSIGHAVRAGTQSGGARQAIVHAAEATLVADRLFGVGHVTSYANAQLARFLLAGNDGADLRSLYEHAVGRLAAEDLKRERELLVTLEAYCETFSTQRTAERLQVHRNTVLYRLRRIEEITSLDLEDGPSRLLLQLGALAGRLARQAADPTARALATATPRTLPRPTPEARTA
jgi:purine catabolism regulator